jgi:precorrin-6B methylase 2
MVFMNLNRRELLAGVFAFSATAFAQQASAPKRSPDVPYVPTPQPVVEAMLKLGEVKKGDILYDLGSGDGRIPITAAKLYGVRATGIDINPERIAEAEANAKSEKVTDRVKFLNQDLFEANISDATVVTLYLLPSINLKLRPKLWKDLKPGTRIVSHSFDMGDWQPEKRIEVDGRYLYLWRVPSSPPQLTDTK